MKPLALARAGGARLAVYLLALYKLMRHAQTPRLAKFVAFAVLCYAVSPIDLIPDFIPVIGLLDDIVLVPLGIALVVRLTPRPLWEQCLRDAEVHRETLPRLLWGALVIAAIWVVLLALLAAWIISLW